MTEEKKPEETMASAPVPPASSTDAEILSDYNKLTKEGFTKDQIVDQLVIKHNSTGDYVRNIIDPVEEPPEGPAT